MIKELQDDCRLCRSSRAGKITENLPEGTRMSISSFRL
jgi:hypothetical protein